MAAVEALTLDPLDQDPYRRALYPDPAVRPQTLRGAYHSRHSAETFL